MMKKVNNYFLLLIIIVFSFNNGYSWGDKGHSTIGKMSLKYLPKEMEAFKAFEDYMYQHSKDPDNRKGADKTEPNKHFIDIDFYKEFNDGRMEENLDTLKTRYSEKDIMKNGILPWATQETYNKLVQAFKEANKEKVLLYMTDLSHYVGDGHQPMHSLTNYNGQLTGQKGIHARYEITMVDKHIDELENTFSYRDVQYIQNPLDFAFNYITNTNIISKIVFDADNYAFEKAGAREGDEYYRLMWFRTGYVTKISVNQAAYDLACLIYSAWKDAGKPSFESIK